MTAISETALKEILQNADALIPGILSDYDIKQEMNKHGHIIIDPYDEKLLKNCSYEIQLDDQIWRMNNGTVYNVDEKEAWYGPLALPSATKDSYGLAKDQRYLLLRPQETVLVSTKETLGSKVHIVSQLLPDPNLSTVTVSTRTMEIGTVGKCYYTIRNNAFCPIIIPTGKTVARLVFYRSTMPDSPSSPPSEDEKVEAKESTPDVITIEAVVEKAIPDFSLPHNGRLPHARPLPPPSTPPTLEDRKRALRLRSTAGKN